MFMPLYFNAHTTGFPGGEIRGQWQCFATDNGEVLTGTARGDILPGLGGDDQVQGLDGDDDIDGGTGRDRLSGGQGDDTVVGGLGKDILQGNAGVDVLTGGTSKDKFVFNRINDSPSGGTADLVTDFNPTGGDRIDVSKIDADNSTAGNQAFTVVAAFTGAGEEAVLTYLAGPDQTRLDLDGNNDGLADFSLLIDGNHTASLGYVL